MQRVARFQRLYAATKDLPWVWGQTDCSILVAHWAAANGFTDPAVHLCAKSCDVDWPGGIARKRVEMRGTPGTYQAPKSARSSI